MKRVAGIHISTFMIAPIFAKPASSHPTGPKTIRFVG